MRHLGSVFLSLILGVLIWPFLGFGAVKLQEGLGFDPDYLAAVVGLGALLVAGALYSVLMLARLSPLGPVLLGLAYLGLTGWALVDRDGFLAAMPNSVLGTRGTFEVPVSGYAAVLAVPLLCTIFSPRRWRRYGDRTPEVAMVAPAPGYPAPLAGAESWPPPPGVQPTATQPLAPPPYPPYGDPESTHKL